MRITVSIYYFSITVIFFLFLCVYITPSKQTVERKGYPMNSSEHSEVTVLIDLTVRISFIDFEIGHYKPSLSVPVYLRECSGRFQHPTAPISEIHFYFYGVHHCLLSFSISVYTRRRPPPLLRTIRAMSAPSGALTLATMRACSWRNALRSLASSGTTLE